MAMTSRLRVLLLVGSVALAAAAAACVGDATPVAGTDAGVDSSLPDAANDQNVADTSPPSDSGADAAGDAGCPKSTALACGAGTPCTLGAQLCCYKSGLSGSCPSADAGGDAGTPCNELLGFGTFHCNDSTECTNGDVCCAYQRNTLQPATFPRQWTSTCQAKCPPGVGTTFGHRILCKCDSDCAQNIHCKPDDGGTSFDGSVANNLPPGYMSCQP